MSEFLQAIKARADELALLGAPLDAEDLTEKILDGLSDEYKELVRAVQARDTIITFEELHEKLLNFEASVLTTKPEPSHFPATANPTSRNTTTWRPPANSGTNNPSWRPSNNNTNRYLTAPNSGPTTTQGNRPSRPFLGYCQICRLQGHTAKRCPSFRLVPVQTYNNNPNASNNHPASSWQPRAHYAANTPTYPSWLLDSGASYHVTSGLSNLSLHAPYNGPDDIMIGDGSGLSITHTGSTSLKTSQKHFSIEQCPLCS